MMYKGICFSIGMLLVMVLAACERNYSIDSPTDDSIHTTPPAEFKVSYIFKPQALPKMTLNSYNVKPYFVAQKKNATATGADLEPYLIEGQNLFHVYPPLGPMVTFIYDTIGPNIVVLSAELNGATATISGLAVDEMGVVSASVNGDEINVAADGSFTVETPEVDIYTYNTEDTLGHTNTVQYAFLGMEHDPSLTVKINQAGLDFAMVQIVNALNVADINSLVAGTELYDSTWQGAFGETYGADGFIKTLQLSASEFNMHLSNGVNAAFDGVIPNLDIEITLRMHNGLLPPTLIEISAVAGPIDIAGDMSLSVTDHMPDVQISNFSFNITGDIDFQNVGSLGDVILGGITTSLLNLLNGVVSDLLEDELKEAIPDMLAGIIKESYTIGISDGVTDRQMAMAISLSSITTSQSALFVGMAGGVIPINPDMDIPQPLTGTLYTSDPLPDAELGEGDFAVSVNTNVINQTLASAHSVGLTQMNIVGDQVQFGLPRDDNFGDPEETSRILVNTLAPATVAIDNVAGAAAMTLSIYGIEISKESIKNGQSSFSNDIGIRANLSVTVDVSVGDDNTLDITLSKEPRVVTTAMRVGAGGWVWGTNLFTSLVNGLINNAVNKVIQELVRPIASVEIPSFSCMVFNVDSITAVGGKESHLNIDGTLTKVSNECDNVVVGPPDVAYGRGVGTPLTCASDEEYDAGLCYEPCDENYDGVGPVCWRQEASYGRGVGTVPGNCAAGEEMDAGLCYPVCNAGYHGVGPVCWNDSPSSYGRGAGTIPINIWTGECPAGKEHDAGLCYPYCSEGYTGVGPVCWLDNASYGRGVGTTPSTCDAGDELDAGLCYPICAGGYHGVGPVCWTNDALSYGRGVGVPIHTCADGMEEDASLCYIACDDGFNGVGPVCWPDE